MITRQVEDTFNERKAHVYQVNVNYDTNRSLLWTEFRLWQEFVNDHTIAVETYTFS